MIELLRPTVTPGATNLSRQQLRDPISSRRFKEIRDESAEMDEQGDLELRNLHTGN